MSIGDIVVAGKNFGMGSSREQAAQVLTKLGIAAVIASSFGGIFYRNAFNLGLPAIISADVNQIEQDHKVVIDFKTGKISNGSTGKSLNGDIIPENLLALVEAGGLVPYLDRKLNQK